MRVLPKRIRQITAVDLTEAGEREVNVITPRIAALLSKHGKKIADEVRKLYAEQVGKFTKARKKDLVDSIELTWDDIAKALEKPLQQVFEQGGKRVFEQVTTDATTDMFDQVHTEAVDFAKDRAAELVGKKWVKGKLVNNPDAEWAITATTRKNLNALVNKALEDGMTPSELKQAILNSTDFSERRAEMIARTELGFAHVAGYRKGAEVSGAVAHSSHLGSEHDRDDECDDAASDGIIPIDQPFSNGMMGPLYHPDCVCAEEFYFADEIADELALWDELAAEVDAEIQKYGTHESVMHAWDTRGRGRKPRTAITREGWVLPDGKFEENRIATGTGEHNETAKRLGYGGYGSAYKAGLIRVSRNAESWHLETTYELGEKGLKAHLKNIVSRLPKGANVMVTAGAKTYEWTGKEFKEYRYDPFKAVTAILAKYELEGHTVFQGLPIAIENEEGSVRSGVGKDGKSWEITMTYPYGYIEGTEGTDGDEVDCFLGPYPEATHAYVIHTSDVNSGEFDEDKVMLGFDSAQSALDSFLENYSDARFFRDIVSVPMDKLKELLTAQGDSIAAPKSVKAELRKHGTHESVIHSWDTRGRGRHPKEKEKDDRSARAKESGKGMDIHMRRLADHCEDLVHKATGGTLFSDNSPFDIGIGRNIGIEVKAFINNTNDKITMHPSSRQLKENAAKHFKSGVVTIVVDTRPAGTGEYLPGSGDALKHHSASRYHFYVKGGVGAFRLKNMTKVSYKDLRTKIKTLAEKV